MTSFRALFIRNAAVAALVPLLVFSLLLLRSQEQGIRAALDRNMSTELTTLQHLFAATPTRKLRAVLPPLQNTLGMRITVIARSGKVLADNEGTADRMENQLNHAEIQAALRDGTGVSERRSSTPGVLMRYLAVAEVGGKSPIYRAALLLTPLQTQVRETRFLLLSTLIFSILCALFVAGRLSQQIVTPVEALSDAAARFSTGDPYAHVLPDGPEALHRLGSTFNEMVSRLNTQVRRLDEAQGYLDAVIRQIPEGLLVVDSTGVITRANAAAEALLRLPSERILGRPVLGVLLSYALDTAVRRVLEGQAVSTTESRSPDGKPLLITVGPLTGRGEGSGAVVLLQDVTELRRADEVRRDFVANVSHELRTPAAAIRALAETLQLRAARRPELLQEYTPRIVTECERIDRLVENLLLLAQTEAGHLRMNLEAVSTREAAAEVVHQVEPLAAASGTELVLEGFAPEPVVADRFALGQCFRNLVDNAVRYAAGGVVRIGSRVEDGQVVIYVSDNGPGVPAEDLLRIFERFYRVDKGRSREVGGSGLGLSIVRHLCEVQGGKAWAESRPGDGSTFFLAFPLSRG